MFSSLAEKIPQVSASVKLFSKYRNMKYIRNICGETYQELKTIHLIILNTVSIQLVQTECCFVFTQVQGYTIFSDNLINLPVSKAIPALFLNFYFYFDLWLGARNVTGTFEKRAPVTI